MTIGQTGALVALLRISGPVCSAFYITVCYRDPDFSQKVHCVTRILACGYCVVEHKIVDIAQSYQPGIKGIVNEIVELLSEALHEVVKELDAPWPATVPFLKTLYREQGEAAIDQDPEIIPFWTVET